MIQFVATSCIFGTKEEYKILENLKEKCESFSTIKV
jgi:hypothetical protein